MRKAAFESGYNLIALTIAVTVLNVLLAASLPLWSTAMQRDKEEELIFRGLQYAEGIRLFQRRFGRFPVRLQELIEVEPRCMRQLWRDPMMDDGEWGLIFATPGRQPGAPNNPNVPSPPNVGGTPPRGSSGNDGGIEIPEATSDLGGDPERTVTVGPIEGVYSRSTETSYLAFLNQDTYNAWKFRVGLVTTPVGIQGQPGNVAPALNSRWIGRPLPASVQLPQGNAPSAPVGVGGDPTVLPGSGNLPPNPRRQLPNTFGGGQPQPPPQVPNPPPERQRP